jgi:predicted DNA-binding protein (UPF0251 family)
MPDGFCGCGCGERTRLAPYSDRTLGWVRGQPIRFILGHHQRGRRKPVRYVEQDCGVNPDHMELVTPAENARRGDRAKLTYAEVDEIRALRREGVLQQDVADRFGVSRPTISDIEHGRTWAAPGGVIHA